MAKRTIAPSRRHRVATEEKPERAAEDFVKAVGGEVQTRLPSALIFAPSKHRVSSLLKLTEDKKLEPMALRISPDQKKRINNIAASANSSPAASVRAAIRDVLGKEASLLQKSGFEDVQYRNEVFVTGSDKAGTMAAKMMAAAPEINLADRTETISYRVTPILKMGIDYFCEKYDMKPGEFAFLAVQRALAIEDYIDQKAAE